MTLSYDLNIISYVHCVQYLAGNTCDDAMCLFCVRAQNLLVVVSCHVFSALHYTTSLHTKLELLVRQPCPSECNIVQDKRQWIQITERMQRPTLDKRAQATKKPNDIVPFTNSRERLINCEYENKKHNTGNLLNKLRQFDVHTTEWSSEFVLFFF